MPADFLQALQILILLESLVVDIVESIQYIHEALVVAVSGIPVRAERTPEVVVSLAELDLSNLLVLEELCGVQIALIAGVRFYQNVFHLAKFLGTDHHLWVEIVILQMLVVNGPILVNLFYTVIELFLGLELADLALGLSFLLLLALLP